MKDTYSTIVSNRHVKNNYWVIKLETGWKDYTPGQFIMLDIPGETTFLRRPFSVARLVDGVVEICYKMVGEGTSAMTRLPVGSKLLALGPLGNGFAIPATTTLAGRCNTLRHLLVAGGYGIAPLLGLAERLRGQDIHLFYGAKTAEDLLYLDEFKKLCVELHLTTEDGSKGEDGLVTDVLKKFLRQRTNALYACGPKAMLDSVRTIAPSHQIQLSLESYMACGSGVCLGCVVQDKQGEYVRVCREGPVFDAEALKCLSA